MASRLTKKVFLINKSQFNIRQILVGLETGLGRGKKPKVDNCSSFGMMTAKYD